jgi:hypothetical protein
MDVLAALDAIAAEAAHGDLVFTTHAEIALRVQRALEDPDCSIERLSKLIVAEPVLAAKIVSMANSAAYNPAGREVSGIGQAIGRLGFKTLHTLTMAIVVRQMQEMSGSAEQKDLARRLWQHTAHVAALARVIARRVTRQDPEAAFFAGIVHEVGGFYLIARAAAFPSLLKSDLSPWHGEGEAALGRSLLAALGVPATISDALETLWQGYLAMPPRSLGDTLLLADQLSPVESPLGELAGMGRRGLPADLDLLIDEEMLSSILADSAAEVDGLSQALQS